MKTNSSRLLTGLLCIVLVMIMAVPWSGHVAVFAANHADTDAAQANPAPSYRDNNIALQNNASDQTGAGTTEGDHDTNHQGNIDISDPVDTAEESVNDSSNNGQADVPDNVSNKTQQMRGGAKAPAANDPAITTVELRAHGDVSTADHALKTYAAAYTYGGYPNLSSMTGYYSYENLEPDTDYKIKITKSHTADSAYTTTATTGFRSSATGSGTYIDYYFRLITWQSTKAGKYQVSVEILTTDDVSVCKSAVPAGDESASFILCGIDSMEVTVVGQTQSGYRYVTEGDVSQQDIGATIKCKELLPNTEYEIRARLAHIASDYATPKTVSDVTTRRATTDASGSVTFDLDYQLTETKLSKQGFYTSLFEVGPVEGGDFTYRFSPQQLWDHVIPPSDKLYYVEDNAPAEKPTLVEVTFTNHIAGTNQLIPGSKFKLVKGEDPEGQDVVDAWTHGSEAHKTTLEPGSYTLVQESVPGGYKTAKPVTFTVTTDDARSRGYNFEASAGPDQNNSYSYLIRKDRSEEIGEVVFCINYGKPFGTRIDTEKSELLYYTEYDLQDAQLNSVIETPRLPLDELRAKLLQITYAGYPNDQEGLKAKYQLSDYELNRATQAAIHYYTDSVDWPRADFASENAYRAYQELIATNITPPTGMTLKIYMPTNDIYQALISTSFRDEDPVLEIKVFNEKEPSEDKVPRDKKDKEAFTEQGSGKVTPVAQHSQVAGHTPYQTGDDTHLALWFSLMGVALTGLIITFTSHRQRSGK